MTIIRMRDVPSVLMTQEITRVLRALCQEPGTDIYIISHWHIEDVK